MKKLFCLLLGLSVALAACGAPAQPASGEPQAQSVELVSSLELAYANQFTADTYSDGSTLITIYGSDHFLLVPEGVTPAEELTKNAVVLRQPLDSIYICATSAMDYFCSFGGLENIAFSGTDAKGWYIPQASEAVANGAIAYAGKYSAPNFEQLLAGGCDLSIQSTMILHKPEIKEQLEELGIPVIVDRSSYETHPLGRLEWIKLYGLLTGHLEEASAIYEKEMARMQAVMDKPATGKTVAFFYITGNGAVSVRKSADYIPSIIRLAGGEYIFPNLGEGENALSTTTIQMEEFYAGAREADYLIYNCSIDDEMTTVEQLLEKSGLLADFKAVEAGHVYATGKDLFQETMGMSLFMADLHAMLTEENFSAGEYIHKLN